jgi:parallel beta-helix repeat protein
MVMLPGVAISAGDTYYVSVSGSDSSSGSQSSPFATVEHAARSAKPGDTVLVRGGTYQEGEVWLRAEHGHCGAPGKLLTIKAYSNETPVFVNSKRPFIIECDYIRIEGLHFRNGKSIGAGGLKRTTIQLVNNNFSGAGYAWDAIGISGNNILLEGNTCDIKASNVGTQGHCYYIQHGTNIRIRNNTARGMTGYGIHIFDQRRGGDHPEFERLIKDVIIEGNVVSNSIQRSGIILAAYDHARIENVIIRNNVLFNNPHSGIYIPGVVSNVKIYNNTIFGNGGAALSIYGTAKEVNSVVIKNNIFDLTNANGSSANAPHVKNEKGNSTIVLENNLYWPKPVKLMKLSDTSALTGDPKFINPRQENFHLQQGSAAINKGVALTDVPADKDGTKRPQGPVFDMGAYEVH